MSVRGRTTTPTPGRTTTPTELKLPPYGRTPEEVFVDRQLSYCDKVVYGFISMVGRGNRASVGERRIAGQLGMDRRSVRRSITNLVARGHLELLPRTGKDRACYRL